MMTMAMVAGKLRSGEMTVDEAVAAFEGDQVLVNEELKLDMATATYEDIEDRGARSTSLWRALTAAGATDAQKDHIGAHIIRLRAIGNTVQARLRG